MNIPELDAPIVKERNLARGNHGRTIHRRDCPMAKRAVAWLWADRVALREVATAIRQFGYHECRRCDPFNSYPPFFETMLEGSS